MLRPARGQWPAGGRRDPCPDACGRSIGTEPSAGRSSGSRRPGRMAPTRNPGRPSRGEVAAAVASSVRGCRRSQRRPRNGFAPFSLLSACPTNSVGWDSKPDRFSQAWNPNPQVRQTGGTCELLWRNNSKQRWLRQRFTCLPPPITITTSAWQLSICLNIQQQHRSLWVESKPVPTDQRARRKLVAVPGQK